MSKTVLEEQNCPIAKASTIIGDVWNILIIRELLDGCKRFNELIGAISGITNSTLSDRLKKLVELGIVERKQYEEIPPKVEYTLSEKGRALETVVNSIRSFGDKWLA